jgi:hypothetical protein
MTQVNGLMVLALALTEPYLMQVVLEWVVRMDLD